MKKTSVESLRDDFMRRWFAIAVSVGFATTVASMQWVKDGTFPIYSEWEHLSRLTVAVLATILSWEGYFQSISKKKLLDIWRYLIDVFLVFIYLFMLLTSKFPYYWLALHAITLCIYIFWDILTISWYPQHYQKSLSQELISENKSVSQIYGLGLIGKDVDRGPVITVTWAIYFVTMWLAFSKSIPHATVVFACSDE